MVSGFVTSPFDHSRIWSGLASEIRIALKLLTSSMLLLRAAPLGRDAIGAWCASDAGLAGPGRRGHASDDGPAGAHRRCARFGDGEDVPQSSNPARLIPPRSGSR